ncbi:hypothetical protein [Nocardia sp. XZ_19_369]|uniref:hypothetical protein n=1 Tax=Nocardia sp. XZ_19_369 TaxID=2769487 RepID=UPI001890A327|nr:hypothetical protein [Nocardia sp. XZ_19_369]
MPDSDIRYQTYDEVLVKLAADPGARITHAEARTIAWRWFTDYYGGTPWNGEEFFSLAHWCDGGPHAEQIARSQLAAEAARLLAEVRDPAIATRWHTWDPAGDPHTAALAVAALAEFLHAGAVQHG